VLTAEIGRAIIALSSQLVLVYLVIITPLLKKGRPGDVQHVQFSLRAVWLSPAAWQYELPQLRRTGCGVAAAGSHASIKPAFGIFPWAVRGGRFC
jgi:hypothetical protein